MNMEKPRAVARLLLTSAALLTALLTALPATAEDAYIDVSGYGEVKAWPDYVELVMNISATDKSADKAKSMVDGSMNQALALLKKYRVASTDIDAARISRQPQWEWNKAGREYRGELISRNLTVRLRDLDRYGDLSNELVRISNLSLNNNRLGFNDTEALQRQATVNALHDARDKASFMTEALNTRLGRVLQISDQNGGHTPVFEMRAMATAKAADPAPMMIQEQTVSASVQVRFGLRD